MSKSVQCKACPWRKDVVAARAIPGGYCRAKHEALRGTVRSGPESMTGPMRVMARHESPTGEERACAGWVANQAGSGNNLGVRLALMTGRLPVPLVVGEQHERFDDTLGGDES